jgi:hypothetical protein
LQVSKFAVASFAARRQGLKLSAELEMESLLILILTLALVGFVLWAVITYIPMPPMFKNVIVVIIVIFVIIWLIRQLGGKL